MQISGQSMTLMDKAKIRLILFFLKSSMSQEEKYISGFDTHSIFSRLIYFWSLHGVC